MNKKTKIFLAPVSSSALYKNYQRTVMVGIDKTDFLEYQNVNQYQKLLTQNHTVRIWGIKSTKLTPYNKASINDIVLFYHKGFMVGRATISFKDNNQILSEEIWGYDRDKLDGKIEYWENLIFLENFSVINMDFRILIDYASFSPKASVRGFNEYSQLGTNAILKEHGTIEKFLSLHK
jgi:hypothetical protein